MRSFNIKDDKRSLTTLSALRATSPCPGEAKTNNRKSCKGEAKTNIRKQRYDVLRKYAVIVLCLLTMILTAVGFSKWNIHIQQELPVKGGDNFIKYADPAYTTEGAGETQTVTPILEHFLTFEIGSTSESGSGVESGENKTSVINTAKSAKGGISYYQLTYDGNTVGISVSDTYYTKKSDGESGSGVGIDQSDIGALVGWSTLANDGLTFSDTYYRVTENTARSAKSRTLRAQARASADTTYTYDEVAAKNLKNAGNYLCVFTAEDNSVNQTYRDTVENLNSAITNPVKPTDKCAAAVYFTINPKKVTVTWTKNTDGYTYDGKEQHPDALLSGVVSGDDCTVTVSGGTNAGTHTAFATLTGENSANYELTENTECQFEIQPYKLTKSDVAWGDLSFTYDGTAHVPTVSVKNPLPFYNEEDGKYDECPLIVSVENNGKDVGTYLAKVIRASNENYILGEDITTEFTITARPITVAIDAATSVYGENPVTDFTCRVTSGTIVSGDNAEDIFTLISNVDKKSYAGSYDIRGSTENATNKNYDVNFEGGTNAYTVTARKIKVIMNDAEHTYGGEPQKIIYRAVSNYDAPLSAPLASGDKESDIFSLYVADSNNNKITLKNNTAAGDYSIKGKTLGNGNYEVAFCNEKEDATYAAYKVEKALLTVKPLPTTVTQGKTPDYKYEISGFITALGDTIDNVMITGKVLFSSDYTGYPNEATEIGEFKFCINSDSDKSDLQAINYGFYYSDEYAKLIVEESVILIPVPTRFKVNFTYDGTKKEVTIKDLDVDNEYWPYIKLSGLSGSVTSAIDAGTYPAKITFTEIGEKNGAKWQKADGTLTTRDQSVDWTISPCKLSIKDKVIESDYADGGVSLSRDLFSEKIIDDKIIDGNNNTSNAAVTDYASVVSIVYARNDLSLESAIQDNDNGKFYYVDGDTITAGSTYEIKLSLENNKNYVFDDGTDKGASTAIAYLKYKTARVGGTLYTIEDAITTADSTENIILKGNDTSYVVTCFTNLPFYNSTKTYTLSNKNLVVPYKDGITGTTEDDYQTKTVGQDAVYSVLCIPNGVTLNMKGVTIDITASVVFKTNGVCTTYNRGVVMNNGTINVTENGKIQAYGYLKGNNDGIINLTQGTITDLFHMYDYIGGNGTQALNGANYFPVSSYSIHNVSCKTRIYDGSTYECFFSINATIPVVNTEIWPNGTIAIISSKDGALFQFTGGYVEKSADKALAWDEKTANGKALNTIEGSNQIAGQREIINICDGAQVVDNSIKISFSSYDMETSPETACPIPYMNVTVQKGCSLTLSSASYKFLPGTVLTIDGTFTSGKDVTIAFLTTKQSATIQSVPYYSQIFEPVDKNNAVFIVNGTAVFNGSVSGKIETENADAKLTIGKNSAKTKYVTAIKTGGLTYSATTKDYGPMYAQGNVLKSSDSYIERTLASGTYLSKKVDGIHAWYSENITISYNSNGGNAIDSKTHEGIGNEGYNISDADLPKSNIEKDYYTFDAWYYDELCTMPVKVGDVLFASTYLYAGWTPIEYTIKYSYVYDGVPSSDIGKNPPSESTKFTAESGAVSSSLLDVETIDDLANYVLTGWYIDSACNMKVSTALELLENTTSLNGTTITVYGVWTVYVASFKVEFTTGIGTAPDGVDYSSENVTVANQSSWKPDKQYDIYKTNSDSEYYFGGWYTDKDCMTEFSQFTDKKEGENQILYAKWIQKRELIINYNAQENHTKKYYLSGETLTLGDISTYSQLLGSSIVPSGYKFAGFKPSSGFESSTVTINDDGTVTTGLVVDNTADSLVVIPDIRKIVKVNLLVTTTISYTYSVKIIITYNFIGNGNFDLGNVIVQNNIFYSVDGETWNNRGATISESSLWLLAGDSCNVEISNVKVEARGKNTDISGSSHIFTIATISPTSDSSNTAIGKLYSGAVDGEDGTSTYTVTVEENPEKDDVTITWGSTVTRTTQ